MTMNFIILFAALIPFATGAGIRGGMLINLFYAMDSNTNFIVRFCVSSEYL